MTAVPGELDGSLRVETLTYGHAVRVLLHGEADIATLARLEVALATVNLAGADTVHIDVSELDFLDVATLSRLVAFANEVKRTGRQITVFGARPVLHKMARILKVQNDLGLA